MHNELYYLSVGIACGLAAGGGATSLIKDYIMRKRIIPNDKNIEEGYVQPSKLEISAKDLTGDGKKEVLMKYDGKQYLLRQDEKGKPEVMDYTIKPL